MFIGPPSREFKVDFDQIFDNSAKHERSTKIICTLGPACEDVSTMIDMLDAGMNVARLNFSHGDHASQQKLLDNLRDAMIYSKN